jgi:hypothetical protein
MNQAFNDLFIINPENFRPVNQATAALVIAALLQRK